jgi:hypothetical protein
LSFDTFAAPLTVEIGTSRLPTDGRFRITATLGPSDPITRDTPPADTGYTQADITLFQFDAAGAPAEHVRCRRYRVDGRHTLRKVPLASPESLGGTERQREMNLAEGIGKERI